MPARIFEKCTIDGCENKHYGHGLCSKHYQQQPHVREKKKKIAKKYYENGGGKGALRRYKEKPEYKEQRKKTNARYEQKEETKQKRKEYRKSEHMMLCARNGQHRRRVRLKSAGVEFFYAEEIFERDNWVCGICGEVVDRTLTHPHPLSKSLDHIVPISRGGNHSRDNVQLAHLVCNIKKGNRNG